MLNEPTFPLAYYWNSPVLIIDIAPIPQQKASYL